MKEITLQTIELLNFKGAKELKVEFNGQNVAIEGANGTGKSTIYEAYLWCLFGKNSNGNVLNVQPCDANGNIVHNLTTSVTVVLKVDGFLTTITKTLEEEWTTARGKNEAKLKGTTTNRYINTVPMSKADFEGRLSDICPMEDWFNLSSIMIIPGMKQENRRTLLKRIAPNVNIESIMAKYPAVLDAHYERKSADELMAQAKDTLKRANSDMDTIPARINELEALRENMDYNAIEANLKKVKDEMESLQKQKDAIAAGLTSEEEKDDLRRLRSLINNLETNIEEAKGDALKKYQEEVNALRAHENDLNWRSGEQRRRVDQIEDSTNQINKQIAAGNARLEELRTKYKQVNEQQNPYEGDTYAEPELDMTCPTCGQTFTPERQSQIRATHKANWQADHDKRSKEWLETKAKDVKGIIEEAQSTKAHLVTLKANLEELRNKSGEALHEIDELQKDINLIPTKRAAITTVEARLEQNPDYQKAIEDLKRAQAEYQEKKNATVGKEQTMADQIAPIELKLQKKKAEEGELLKGLGTRTVNDRISKQKADLEAQRQNLVDIIAKWEGVRDQVLAFKKEYILEVEQSASSLFTMVKWKLYEPNVTNDGEKEICQAIVDGVPYDQTNKATQFNAAVDIINGFSQAMGYHLPLFIDNKESVTNILPSVGQMITLSVAAEKTLTISKK